MTGKTDNKSKIRQARRDARMQGPLYIDPKYLKDGYKYLFATDAPGYIEMKERLGWVIVRDNIEVGDKTAANSSRFHGAVLVKSKCGQTLVLMTIADDEYEEIQQVIKEDNDAVMNSIGRVDGIDAHNQTGSIQHLKK